MLLSGVEGINGEYALGGGELLMALHVDSRGTRTTVYARRAK